MLSFSQFEKGMRGGGTDGHAEVRAALRTLGAKLTQEEVFVLVVVGQVFQLLLAILRREERE